MKHLAYSKQATNAGCYHNYLQISPVSCPETHSRAETWTQFSLWTASLVFNGLMTYTIMSICLMVFIQRRGKRGKSGRLSLPAKRSGKPTWSLHAPSLHGYNPRAYTHVAHKDYWHGVPWSSLEKVLNHKLLEGCNHGFGSHHKIDP